MNSVMNLAILYCLALLTLYPFDAQPGTTLIVLTALTGFVFHLVPVGRVLTVVWMAGVAVGISVVPEAAPFAALPVYTVMVDRFGQDLGPVDLRVREGAALAVWVTVAVRLASGDDPWAGWYDLVLLGLAVWLAYGGARAFRTRRERDRLLEAVRTLEIDAVDYGRNVEVGRAQAAERARLEERERIARDMHDSVGHSLTSSLLQTAALEAVNEDPALRPLLRQLHETLDRGMTQTRRHLHHLEATGTDVARELGRLAEGFGCPVTRDVRLYGPMPSGLAQQVIAVVSEALTNVSKHASATAVEVELREFPKFYRLTVRDNGVGIPPDRLRRLTDGTAAGGMGLRSMRRRAEDEGGHFTASNDGGLKLVVTFPRAHTKEDT